MRFPWWWYDNHKFPGVWRIAVSAVLLVVAAYGCEAQHERQTECRPGYPKHNEWLDLKELDAMPGYELEPWEVRQLVRLNRLCQRGDRG